MPLHPPQRPRRPSEKLRDIQAVREATAQPPRTSSALGPPPPTSRARSASSVVASGQAGAAGERPVPGAGHPKPGPLRRDSASKPRPANGFRRSRQRTTSEQIHTSPSLPTRGPPPKPKPGSKPRPVPGPRPSATTGKGPRPSAAALTIVSIFKAERQYVLLLESMVEVLSAVLADEPSDSKGGRLLARFDALLQANKALFVKLSGRADTPFSVVQTCTAFLGTMPRLYAYADFARHRELMKRYLATEMPAKASSELNRYLESKAILPEMLFSKPLAHFMLYPRLVSKLQTCELLSGADISAINEVLGRLKDLKMAVQEQASISRGYGRVEDELAMIEPVPELTGILHLGQKLVEAGETIVFELGLDELMHTPRAPSKTVDSYPARFCLLTDSLLIQRRKRKVKNHRIYTLQLKLSAATLAMERELDHDRDALRVHDHKHLLELLFESPERKAEFIAGVEEVKRTFATQHALSSSSASLTLDGSLVPGHAGADSSSSFRLPLIELGSQHDVATVVSSIARVRDVATCESLPQLTAYVQSLDVAIEALSLGAAVSDDTTLRPERDQRTVVMAAYEARETIAANARLDAILEDAVGGKRPTPPARPPASSKPPPAATAVLANSSSRTLVWDSSVTSVAFPGPDGLVCVNPRALDKDQLVKAYLVAVNELARMRAASRP
ncbi:uncharacterized protein AMSG_00875 [Thecamonas trahens ATCC 50062]|uniref:DH domain-containing protein n=1 Tax=Thecamonas trahens ATCC 50062 TaxID=461836 RepID=A0A0L0DL02_THETB|nr:hypothetical protein AMSG_00875 [Thecamonas trahens ATCC 50062]KNC52048.1 hypothetical protein AMSG_00875 [Thecamonas trahens ATCC 50062]|eukprot:XP_013762054.1 hypothetical protein AMSG_00875 [Thecamonas trahens ATCC 50062]